MNIIVLPGCEISQIPKEQERGRREEDFIIPQIGDFFPDMPRRGGLLLTRTDIAHTCRFKDPLSCTDVSRIYVGASGLTYSRTLGT